MFLDVPIVSFLAISPPVDCGRGDILFQVRKEFEKSFSLPNIAKFTQIDVSVYQQQRQKTTHELAIELIEFQIPCTVKRVRIFRCLK
jgi:hypothetical protein